MSFSREEQIGSGIVGCWKMPRVYHRIKQQPFFRHSITRSDDKRGSFVTGEHTWRNAWTCSLSWLQQTYTLSPNSSDCHPHTAISTDDLSRTPSTIVRAEHANDASNLLRVSRPTTHKPRLLNNAFLIHLISNSCHGCVHYPRFQSRLMFIRHLIPHVRFDWAWVDSIHRAPT